MGYTGGMGERRITHSSRKQPRRYRPRASEQDLALAYQLYVYECGRNCGAVARRLNVSVELVSNWAKRGEWAMKADAELARIMPDLVKQTGHNLRLGAWLASRRLNEIMAKDEPIPYKEVDALIKTAAIGGFSAVGKNPLPAIEPGAEQPTPSEDIEKIIEAHHRRLGIGQADEAD